MVFTSACDAGAARASPLGRFCGRATCGGCACCCTAAGGACGLMLKLTPVSRSRGTGSGMPLLTATFGSGRRFLSAAHASSCARSGRCENVLLCVTCARARRAA